MLTRLLILAVLWFALFRFLGRLLRFLAGERSPAGRRPPGRSSSQGAADTSAGASARRNSDVIDVDYEDLTPRAGS